MLHYDFMKRQFIKKLWGSNKGSSYLFLFGTKNGIWGLRFEVWGLIIYLVLSSLPLFSQGILFRTLFLLLVWCHNCKETFTILGSEYQTQWHGFQVQYLNVFSKQEFPRLVNQYSTLLIKNKFLFLNPSLIISKCCWSKHAGSECQI